MFWGVRRSSWLASAFMAIGALFLLAGYECVRTPSNTLFKLAFGRDLLPLVIATTPLAVALTLLVYNRVLTRYGPRVTMALSTATAGWSLVVCAILIGAGATWLSFGLYLIREVYIILLLEQLWSFLNSRLNRAEGAKLFGPICAVASLGAVGVGYFAPAIVSTLLPWQQPLVAVCLIPLTLVFFDFAFRTAGEPTDVSIAPSQAVQLAPGSDRLGLSEFRKHAVLVMILCAVCATQIYSAMLEISLQTALDTTYTNPQERDEVSIRFFGHINLAAAILQIAAVPLLLRFVPLAAIHLGIPVLHLALFSISLFLPGFAPVAAAYLVFKAVDYSLFKAAKELLYIPLPFDSRYRAKEWIDSLGYRTGKGMGGILTLILARSIGAIGLAGATTLIAIAALAAWISAVWVWVAKKPLTQRTVHSAAKSNGKSDAESNSESNKNRR